MTNWDVGSGGVCAGSGPGRSKANLGGIENVGWELGQCRPKVLYRVSYFIQKKK